MLSLLREISASTRNLTLLSLIALAVRSVFERGIAIASSVIAAAEFTWVAFIHVA